MDGCLLLLFQVFGGELSKEGVGLSLGLLASQWDATIGENFAFLYVHGALPVAFQGLVFFLEFLVAQGFKLSLFSLLEIHHLLIEDLGRANLPRSVLLRIFVPFR